jgi:hypothetical protein
MTKKLPMKFNPIGGAPLRERTPTEAANWRPYAGANPNAFKGAEWRFNPWTGDVRSMRDIESDPFGLLIDDGEPLRPFMGDSRAADGSRVVSYGVIPPVVPPVDRRAPAASPDTANPKDAAGRAKVPLWLLSPVAKAAWAMAQFVGKVKYGAWNWRGTQVLASVYLSAAMRHLDAYLSGETYDPDDGTHHLGNVMACCAILLDAAACGKLIDDRPPSESHRPAYKDAEAIVAPTEKRYADRKVKHWTIADSVAGATLPEPSTEGENHGTAAPRDATA